MTKSKKLVAFVIFPLLFLLLIIITLITSKLDFLHYVPFPLLNRLFNYKRVLIV